MKKITAAALCLVLLICSVSAVSAAGASASLYSVYGDGMIFRAGCVSSVMGTARDGSVISMKITGNTNNRIITGETTAEGGEFAISFTAPGGGFDEYTVSLYENGVLFDTLENVLFGEVWLASGQSNMQMGYSQTLEYGETVGQLREEGKYIRFLEVPALPLYEGSVSKTPCSVQNDAPGSYWTDATEYPVANSSAVAVYFAWNLYKKLGMPLAILDSSLGGSSISTWLPRETIENDPAVLAEYKASGEYIPASAWKEDDVSRYSDMTCNYNLKIYPLRGFSVSGMIWYQGESDAMMGRLSGRYTKNLERLQKCNSEIFGRDDSLPIVLTDLAEFEYGDGGNKLNAIRQEMYAFQDGDTSSRAVAAIYDELPLFNPATGTIHPINKLFVGERLAASAYNMVYSDGAYLTPTVSDITFENGGATVRFNHTADGLATKDGKAVKGFYASGDDGILVAADAEIVSDDTVFVTCPSLESISVLTYGSGTATHFCNLCATDGDRILPVSVFAKGAYRKNAGANLWMDCEEAETWHSTDGDAVGYYDSWLSSDAEISFTGDAAYSGERGLNVTSENTLFTVFPCIAKKVAFNATVFTDDNTDWTGYESVSFMVRNNGGEDVMLIGATACVNSLLLCALTMNDDCRTYLNIPADGEWHEVTLHLNELRLGGRLGLTFSNEILRKVTAFTLTFRSESASDLDIDAFSFTGDNGDTAKLTLPHCLVLFIEMIKGWFCR